MPKTITVPTVEDVKNEVEEFVDNTVDAVEGDLQETKEKSRPSNLTVTQKTVGVVVIVAGAALIYRKIKQIRRSLKVEVEVEETGEVIDGTLIVD